MSTKRATGLRKLGEVPCAELLKASRFPAENPETLKRQRSAVAGTSDDEVTRDEEDEATAQQVSGLAAHEFTLRQQSSKRDFLLNFCQDENEIASEVSDSEKNDDLVALKAGFKSVSQSAMRKKILAINQQGDG